MFCPNCGTQLDDSARFCGSCGQTLAPAPAQEPTPVQAPVAVTSKKEFVEKVGSPKIKQAWLIALIAFGVCALLLLLGLNSALNGQFYDIPILGLVMGSEGKEEVQESQKDAARYLEELESIIDEQDLSTKEQKLVKNVMKSYKKLIKTISISGVTDTCKKLEAAEDVLGDSDMFDEMVDIMNVFTTLIYIFFAIPMIFTIFGGWKRSVGLTVTGMIFAILFFLIFGGIIWGILALAAYIVQINFASTVNKSYKAYRQTGVAA